MQLNLPSPVHAKKDQNQTSSLFHLLNQPELQEDNTPQNRYTLPSFSNIFSAIPDINFMPDLPPIVTTNVVEPSIPSPKQTSDMMDWSNLDWLNSRDMDYEIPASPSMSEVSSRYEMYDSVMQESCNEMSVDNELPAVSDDLGIENPVFTADKQPSEAVQTPAFSIFSETKKRAEKRRRADSAVDGGDKAVIDYKSLPATKKTKQLVFSNDLGQSKSATWERKQREIHTKDTLNIDNKKLQEFKNKIRKLDEHAEVMDGETVRHVKCGKSLSMKYAYSVGNFKTHLKTCKGPPKCSKLSGGGMKTLTSMLHPNASARPTTAHLKNDGDPSTSSRPSGSGTKTIMSMLQQNRGVVANSKKDDVQLFNNSLPPTSKPCPGLGKTNNAKIEVYLERSGAQGGGSNSVTVTTKLLFGKNTTYADLNNKRKRQVDTVRVHDSQWRNDRAARHIFSTACLKMVSSSAPCSSCLALLKLKAFRNALSIPLPDDENYKYNNHAYQEKSHIGLYAKCSGLQAIIEAEVSCHTFELSISTYP